MEKGVSGITRVRNRSQTSCKKCSVRVANSTGVCSYSAELFVYKTAFALPLEMVLIVTLPSVMLLSVVTVLPSWIAVLPKVIVVAKLLSNCDKGIAAVALLKVYGTAI